MNEWTPFSCWIGCGLNKRPSPIQLPPLKSGESSPPKSAVWCLLRFILRPVSSFLTLLLRLVLIGNGIGRGVLFLVFVKNDILNEIIIS